jgi:hypothetical protein
MTEIDTEPTLVSMPDEIIVHILEMLMAVDPKTLIMSAPNLCQSLRTVCRDQISLELRGRWWDLPSRPRFPSEPNRFLQIGISKFRWVKALSVKMVQPFLKTLANPQYLQHLEILYSGDTYSDIVMATMFKSLKRFRIMAGDRYTYEGLHVLTTHCPQLECLFVPYASIKVVSSVYATNCKRLKHLNLHYSIITDVEIGKLSAGCKSLITLDLTGCARITDAAVFALVAGCKSLAALELAGCTQITDAAVYALAAGCKNLTALNLTGCIRISDAAIFDLVAGCKELTDLNLTGCAQISDATIIAVSSCKGLNTRPTAISV